MWTQKSKFAALAAALGAPIALGQTITISPSTTYQIIDGFGFSEAFGFGQSIADASSSIQSQAVNYMFSTTEGAGMTILRNRIAGIEPNAPSGPNAQPTYTWDGNDAGQVLLPVASRIHTTLTNEKMIIGMVVQASQGKWCQIHLRRCLDCSRLHEDKRQYSKPDVLDKTERFDF